MSSELATTKKIIGEKEFEALQRFYRETWSDSVRKYKFRVYLAQKGLNLNEMLYAAEYEYLMKHDPDEGTRLQKIRNETFLTQTGLLLKADELAQYYVENGTFPPILVVDELTLTGRDYSRLMYALEDVVSEAVYAIWEQLYGNSAHVEKYKSLRTKLLEAVDFYTFTQDARGLLVESALWERVTSVRKVYADQWFPYIQNVSKSINYYTGVENTSFVPTFWLGKNDFYAFKNVLADDVWHYSKWNYCGTETTIWQQNAFGRGAAVRVQCAFRCQHDYESDAYFVTPYVLWGALSDKPLDSLFLKIGRYLQGEGYVALGSIFLRSSEKLRETKIQLLATISSVLIFSAVFVDATTFAKSSWTVEQNTDLEKISQCYGNISTVYPEFSRLLYSNSVRQILNKWIFEFLYDNSDAIGYHTVSAGQYGSSAYMLYAENYFLNLEYKIQDTEKIRRRERLNYVPWSNYISWKNAGLKHYLSDSSDIYPSLEEKISALLILLQHGYVGQCVYGEDGSDCYLNVGETSLGIAFKNMYRFVPALTELERICRKNGLDTLCWANRFGVYLTGHGYGRNLGSILYGFVQKIYQCGYLLKNWSQDGVPTLAKPDADKQIRMVQEWSGDPWSEQEWGEIRPLDQGAYVQWEAEKQNKIKNEVEKFFYQT